MSFEEVLQNARKFNEDQYYKNVSADAYVGYTKSEYLYSLLKKQKHETDLLKKLATESKQETTELKQEVKELKHILHEQTKEFEELKEVLKHWFGYGPGSAEFAEAKSNFENNKLKK